MPNEPLKTTLLDVRVLSAAWNVQSNYHLVVDKLNINLKGPTPYYFSRSMKGCECGESSGCKCKESEQV